MIKLGSKVKDTVTEFTGIAVVRSIWLWGCIRIGVQPSEIIDGKPVEEVWFDESRLELVKEGKKKSEINEGKEKHGGPRRENRKIIEG